MCERQADHFRKIARNLAKLGIPFELAAFLVADQMRQRGIPITEQNLDAAFAI